MEVQAWMNWMFGGLALLILGGGMLMMFTTVFTTKGPQPEDSQSDPQKERA
ncbi:hypothetical protein [Thermostichus sp. MS-CIW-28]